MHDFGNGAAIVTGAGRGLGRTFALKLATAGYDVALVDIDETAVSIVASEVAALGRKALAAACDISVLSEVENAAGRIVAQLPELRIVWANAGVAHLGGLASGPSTGFDWIYAVNVQGTINTLRTFVPYLLTQEGERHVGLTCSFAGLTTIGGWTPGYGASKHAMVGLGEALRAELAARGIGVTIACPGVVNTEIWDGARVRPQRFGGPFSAPREIGARHRAQGLSPEWVVDRIWEQVLRGGGYVSPVPDHSALTELDRRCHELRASLRFP